MQTMSDKVTASVEAEGYGRDEDGWEHNAYKVTLHYQGRQMTTRFRTGLGWDREPSASDVLESLLSDAAGIENLRDGDSFEEWAAEYGYDPDSREAEKIYRAVESQTKKLERLLGDDYQAAVFPNDYADSEQVAARLAD